MFRWFLPGTITSLSILFIWSSKFNYYNYPDGSLGLFRLTHFHLVMNQELFQNLIRLRSHTRLPINNKGGNRRYAHLMGTRPIGINSYLKTPRLQSEFRFIWRKP